MRTRTLWITIALTAQLAGCCPQQPVTVTVLPVPPQDSRWQGSDQDRIALPLVSGREQVEDALKFGLNRNNKEDNVAVVLNAKALYKRLLDRLEKPATFSDLSSDVFKQRFPGKIVMQIVDARDLTRPGQHAPVALSDGRYWWIFYRNANDQLTSVMVAKVQAIDTLVEKDK